MARRWATEVQGRSSRFLSRLRLWAQEYRHARRQGDTRKQAILDATFYLLLVMNARMAAEIYPQRSEVAPVTSQDKA